MGCRAPHEINGAVGIAIGLHGSLGGCQSVCLPCSTTRRRGQGEREPRDYPSDAPLFLVEWLPDEIRNSVTFGCDQLRGAQDTVSAVPEAARFTKWAAATVQSGRGRVEVGRCDRRPDTLYDSHASGRSRRAPLHSVAFDGRVLRLGDHAELKFEPSPLRHVRDELGVEQ